MVLIRATLLVNCIKPENAARYGCHVTSLDTVVKSADFNILVHSKRKLKCVQHNYYCFYYSLNYQLYFNPP